jgi:PPOX class probable F420-dependent enzyme
MTLDEVAQLAAGDHYLAVIATTRADASVQASVVNAGVLAHPVGGDRVVGFVTYGQAKLRHLRQRPKATVVFRSGWQWAAVEGTCDIIGPDDPFNAFEASALPALLRDVFQAAGGTHSDWDEYDRVMRDQRRAAVLVHPERIYSNPAT